MHARHVWYAPFAAVCFYLCHMWCDCITDHITQRSRNARNRASIRAIYHTLLPATWLHWRCATAVWNCFTTLFALAVLVAPVVICEARAFMFICSTYYRLHAPNTTNVPPHSPSTLWELHRGARNAHRVQRVVAVVVMVVAFAMRSCCVLWRRIHEWKSRAQSMCMQQ